MWFSGWYAVNSIQSWLIPSLILISNVVSDHLTTIPNLDGDPVSRLIFQEKCTYPGIPYEEFSWELYMRKFYGEGQQLPEPPLDCNIMVVLRPDLFPNRIKTFATKYQLLVWKHSEFLPYPRAIAIKFFMQRLMPWSWGQLNTLNSCWSFTKTDDVPNRQRLQWGVVEKFGCDRSISFALLLHRIGPQLGDAQTFII